jgi:hypothetical protein
LNTAYRSKFVSVVAWPFIVISGFGTVIALLQNIIVQFLGAQMGMMFQAGLSPGTSCFTVLLISHLKLYFAILLAIFAFTFVSSIGLLRRKSWARLAFVFLMVVGVLWNLPGLISSLRAPGVYTLFTIVLIVLFAWIGKRLLSPIAVADFRSER